MKIGITSYVFRWSIGVKGFTPPNRLSALDVIRRAAELGCGSVQLCDHLDLDMDRALIAELTDLAADVGIELEVGVNSTNSDYLVRIFELAQKLGASLIRIVPNVHRANRYEAVEVQIDEEVKLIRAAIKDLANQDLVIALENHSGLKAHELAALVQRVESNQVGVCLDTMNSAALLEPPETTVEVLAPLARTVHLKDFRVISSPSEHMIRGTALGEGMVPFQQFLQKMRRFHAIRSYHIEHYLHPDEADREMLRWEEQAVQRSIDFAIQQLGFERVNRGGV